MCRRHDKICISGHSQSTQAARMLLGKKLTENENRRGTSNPNYQREKWFGFDWRAIFVITARICKQNFIMPLHDHCCVFGCTNRRENRPETEFHHFPEDKEQSGVWIQAIKREEGDYFAVTSHTTVCSEHFDLRCYTESKKMKRLKRGSRPTKCIFKKRHHPMCESFSLWHCTGCML